MDFNKKCWRSALPSSHIYVLDIMKNKTHFSTANERILSMNRQTTGNTFSTLALVCSGLGLVTMCVGVTTLFFAGLAILFALLSRGSAEHVCPQARAGIVISIISLVALAALYAFSFTTIIQQYGSLNEFLQQTIQQTNDIMDTYMNGIGNSL